MIKTIELFAGVGGFRVGLERVNKKTGKEIYKVIWSNQWEPSTITQHASLVYENVFGSEGHSNKNIEDVPTSEIPDHDLLVGGFPCQDYSVATTLRNSKGLLGKKGVLWWSIHRILTEKKRKPKYLIFENVDRMLSSPSTQRGRDFAVMLKSLDELGYAVEWRVINAADYGFPQRRRRVFFIGYHKSTKEYKKIKLDYLDEWVLREGVFAEAFPVGSSVSAERHFDIHGDLHAVSDNFGKGQKISQFMNSGVLWKGHIYTAKTTPNFDGPRVVLRDILVKGKIPQEYYILSEEEDKWRYQKDSKSIIRKSQTGHEYVYAEGKMVFPDSLDAPSRTIITGEGGSAPSRFKHVVATRYGLRRLLPIELERLNMFDDNHTLLPGVSDSKRAFLMGNALVVGIVEDIAQKLSARICGE